MTYKTIVAYLSTLERATPLLAGALPLARAHGAHVVALAVLPPYVVLPAMEGGTASLTVDEHRTLYRREIDRMKAAFEADARGQPFQAEWREADAGFTSIASTVIEQGRTADLIMAAPLSPKGRRAAPIEEEVERLAMESGRPVLLVPEGVTPTLPPRRVTIAWNARREAARAVFDAMPLLTSAEEVNILWVSPEKDQPIAGDLPGAELAASLARHGVKCRTTTASAYGADVGAEILRQAEVFGSDLLVMGAYGHSRLRELVLGGASRHVLGHMTMPVLMSH